MKKKDVLLLMIMSLIISLSIFSCDNDNDPTNNVCDESYVTNALVAAFTSLNGYDDVPEYMDLETHQYNIQINADGEICSVGYQNPSTYSGGYTINIINNTNPAANYSGTHIFSQTILDYQSITPVAVSSGDNITIKRTILQGYTNLGATIGRILKKSNNTVIPYPITQGNVTFLSSTCYGAGGPINNIVQPFIAIGFKVN